VIEVAGRLTGLVVDQVSEVMRVAFASIEPPRQWSVRCWMTPTCRVSPI
jgi:chemotaxis signal transduction protein